jgi:AcrR family transcriptional regulator
VAPQTIYWAFGTKAHLVTEIRERWLAEARTGERFGAVLAVDDPAARLDAYATFITGQWATGADAIAIQEDAMRADPDVERDVRRALEERATVLAEVTRPLAGLLRDGMTAERAHTILLGLSMAQVYLEFRTRGWSDQDYRDWLSQVLREQLL